MARDYYIHDGNERRGPLTQHEVIEMVEGGHTDPEKVLGWHREAEAWKPLGEMPEFLGISPSVEEAISEVGSSEEQTGATTEEVGDGAPEASDPLMYFAKAVGRRGLGRFLDYILIHLPLFLLARPLLDSVPASLLLYVANFVLLIWMETFFLSRTGTTPGKRMVGVGFLDHEDNPPPEKVVFRRALFAWLIFAFLLFPPTFLIVFPIVLAYWYSTGLAPWDRKGELKMNWAPSPRSALVMACVFLCLHLFLGMFTLAFFVLKGTEKLQEISERSNQPVAEETQPAEDQP